MGKEEGKVQRKAFELLRGMPSSYWFKVDQKVRRADPDIVGVVGGWFCAVEVKKKGEEGRRLQKLRATQLRRAGALVAEVDDAEGVKEFIREVNKKLNETD